MAEELEKVMVDMLVNPVEFGEYDFCPKCNQKFIDGFTHHLNMKVIYVQEHNLLQCKCSLCGFVWMERTLDHEENPTD